MAYDVLVVPVDDHFMVSCVDFLSCPKCGGRSIFTLESHEGSSRWRFADRLFYDCAWPDSIFTADDFKASVDSLKGWFYMPAMSEFEIVQWLQNKDFYNTQSELLQSLGLIGSDCFEFYVW